MVGATSSEGFSSDHCKVDNSDDNEGIAGMSAISIYTSAAADNDETK